MRRLVVRLRWFRKRVFDQDDCKSWEILASGAILVIRKDDTRFAIAPGRWTSLESIKSKDGAQPQKPERDSSGRLLGHRLMSDLSDRLRRAVERIEEKRDAASPVSHERSRLNGKIEGVKLAASYIEDEERIFAPSKGA